MAVIAVVGGKGSPGATSTAVALARAWGGVTSRTGIAIDLDPFGGDFAAGALAGSVPAGLGVLALATDRGPEPAAAVTAAAVEVDGASAMLIPGVPDSARGGAIPLAWAVVAGARTDLADQGVDIFVDGGRMDPGTATPVWLPDAAISVLVVRPSLPWVSAARRLARTWPAGSKPHVVVVDAPSPYRVEEVVRAVELPLAGVVAFDPRAALVHSDGLAITGTYRRSAYARSISHLARNLHDLLAVPDEGLAASVATPEEGRR
jgi:hypothetical protein